MIEQFLNIFDNRELALITWIVLVCIVLILIKKFRSFFSEISEIIFSKTFVVIYLLYIFYIFFILYLLNSIRFWDLSLLKITIFWFITVGIVIALNGISKDSIHFRKVAFDCIKITVILEFIINLHVFSYLVELLFIPILIILGIIQGILETEDNLKKYLSNFNFILGFGFLLFLGFGIYKTIIEIKELYTFNTLQNLLLPSILTLFAIPFSYTIALFSSYEVFFNKFNIYNNIDKKTKKSIKIEVIKKAHLNLNLINRINIKFNFNEAANSSSISNYIIKL